MKMDSKTKKIIIIVAVVLVLVVAVFLGVKMLGNKGQNNFQRGQGGPGMQGQRPSGNAIPNNNNGTAPTGEQPTAPADQGNQVPPTGTESVTE